MVGLAMSVQQVARQEFVVLVLGWGDAQLWILAMAVPFLLGPFELPEDVVVVAWYPCFGPVGQPVLRYKKYRLLLVFSLNQGNISPILQRCGR